MTVIMTTDLTTGTTTGIATDSATSSAAASLELLDRSRHSLLEACQSQEVTQRYLQAQLGALRAAAALVAARATPDGHRGPRSLWELLPAVAPELAEWAGFFELVSTRRAGHPVSVREADDLLRQSEVFLDLVCRSLGLPVQLAAHTEVLVPTALAGSVPSTP
ncbi:hypothetical protein GCM10025782_10630 [Pedococcus ginsenosidimutans]|uniref:SAV-6107-like HEPN domain-containing protein n=2 Tax=Pedococcus ginsenosidimutans TaxID=490570 RepID=A0ABP8XXH4_9MICO